MEGDDLTFRVNFAGDGVSKLRERVRDKLKEFMGDYTDDTLVDYVIVLLKNGRSKEEAKNELNVFLGDDSDSFISWLWDHLGSNLDLYVRGESCPNKVAKSKLISGEKAQRTDAKNVDHLESEPERGKPNKLLRSRHGKEWKGLVRNENEQPPLRSAVAANFHVEGDICQKVDRLESEPEREKPNNLLRGRDAKEWKGIVSNDDEPPPLRSAVIANFNVERDTPQKVDHTKRSPSPRPVFERKRSRSDERPHLKREEVAKMTLNAPRRLLQFAVRDAVCSPRPSSLSTPPLLKRLRSTVDCRQRIHSDAVKVRSLGNVFDRLGPGVGESDTTNHMAEFEEAPVEAVQENRDSDHIPMETQTTYIPGTASKTTNKSMPKPLEDQDQPAAAVNISVNVNTWKSPRYQGMREVSDVDIGKFVQEREEDADKAGLYSTGHPAEDADSRTIFVNNVHFAASNDSLSRHFNKFGDVLKVLIVTDTATGKPKGSAYVEFMSKEAAEQALSLDGTSFMSRILKVVRKSTAPPQEGTATPFMALRRISRGSVFAASRFGGVPFPRGIASMYRARLPVSNVGGSRSFQWKRGDTQTTPTETIGVPSNSVVPSLVAPRSLTYVRAETKMDGTSGTV